MNGVGVMMHTFCGGSSHKVSEYIGKKITAVDMKGDKLLVTFDGGKKIAIWDDGQSCCENRYMMTDDDVQSLVGHSLVRIDAKDGTTVRGDEEYFEEHEVCFVEIGTEVGFITIANHNEHNGYYGGFGLEISEVS